MNTVTEIFNNLADFWACQMWTIIWQSSIACFCCANSNFIIQETFCGCKILALDACPIAGCSLCL